MLALALSAPPSGFIPFDGVLLGGFGGLFASHLFRPLGGGTFSALFLGLIFWSASPPQTVMVGFRAHYPGLWEGPGRIWPHGKGIAGWIAPWGELFGVDDRLALVFAAHVGHPRLLFSRLGSFGTPPHTACGKEPGGFGHSWGRGEVVGWFPLGCGGGRHLAFSILLGPSADCYPEGELIGVEGVFVLLGPSEFCTARVCWLG
jgi:hypothetical protein